MASNLDIDSLFREHGAFITRAIERRTGFGEHVDDILQETFLLAFRKQAAFDPERGEVRSWLYGIAGNLSRNHLRSQRRFGLFRERLAVAEEPVVPQQPDAEVESAQAFALVSQALQRLPERQREVFGLYELEGLDGSEIAALLDIPEGTVWTRLHHGRKNFAKVMQRRLAREIGP